MPRTPQQLLVINTVGKDLLVSAGAGSGKTSVMIERAVNYLTTEEGTVERLLMITFTKAAASEMRVKMENELQGVLQRTVDQKKASQIKKQLSLLGQADICTVHKFCQKIISRYFYVLGIDPSFSIIDDAQSAVYVNRAISAVFDRLLNENDEQFLSLLESYNEKRNFNKLNQMVYETSIFLQQSPNVDVFEKQILDFYDDDLNNGKVANIVNDFVCGNLEFYASLFASIRAKAHEIENIKLVGACDKVLAVLGTVKKENGFIKNQQNIYGFNEFPRKPSDKKNMDFEEQNVLFGEIKTELGKAIAKIKDKYIYDESFENIKKDIIFAKQNVAALLKVTKLYMQEFAKIKNENNQVDFGDLEHFALKILENEDVKNQIKNSYDQIYVDEYQDINNIQDGLISSVTKGGNLFLVGDVKQSIYGFRNTNPQIFVDKFNSFMQDGKTKYAEKLNDNFRTDNAVLQFINYIFARSMTEDIAAINYSVDGMLKGGLQFETPENAVQKSCICVIKKEKEEVEKPLARGIYSVKNAETELSEDGDFAKSEGYVIAQKISDLMQKQKVLYDPKRKVMRPIKYSDITLLVQKRSPYVDVIIDTLKSLNIPVNGIGGKNIFDTFEVQVLHNFLKLLYNGQDDYACVSFLTSPCVGVTMQELTDLRLAFPKGKFYEIVEKQCDVNPKLVFATNVIEKAQSILQTGTIFDALNSMINQTNLLYKISKMDDGRQRVLNVKTFVEHFLSHGYNASIVEYFDFIKKSDEVKIPVANSYIENAVSVCTMHESKGLEYPIVFVVATGKNFNKESLQGAKIFSSKYGIGLESFDKENRTKRDSLVRSAIIIEEEQQQIAELLRLLYVALTRAKNNLYITGSLNIEKISHMKGKFDILRQPNFLSMILGVLDDDVLDSLKNGTTKVVVNKNKIDEFAVETYLPFKEEDTNEQNQFEFTQKPINVSALKQKLEQYLNYAYPHKQSTNILGKSSVTKMMKENQEIVSNIDAPQMFVKSEINLETNPEVGIAFHKAMELMDYNLTTEEQVKEHLQKVLTADEFSLVDCGTLTKCVKHFAPLMKDAKVYREQKFFLNVPYNQLVEKSDVVDDVLVEGVIDLLIVKGNEAILVDFKTTNITDINKLRQKYKIQLDCYQKAVENALNCRVSKKIIYSFLNEMEISFDM